MMKDFAVQHQKNTEQLKTHLKLLTKQESKINNLQSKYENETNFKNNDEIHKRLNASLEDVQKKIKTNDNDLNGLSNHFSKLESSQGEHLEEFMNGNKSNQALFRKHEDRIKDLDKEINNQTALYKQQQDTINEQNILIEKLENDLDAMNDTQQVILNKMTTTTLAPSTTKASKWKMTCEILNRGT